MKEINLLDKKIIKSIKSASRNGEYITCAIRKKKKFSHVYEIEIVGEIITDLSSTELNFLLEHISDISKRARKSAKI